MHTLIKLGALAGEVPEENASNELRLKTVRPKANQNAFRVESDGAALEHGVIAQGGERVEDGVRSGRLLHSVDHLGEQAGLEDSSRESRIDSREPVTRALSSC